MLNGRGWGIGGSGSLNVLYSIMRLDLKYTLVVVVVDSDVYDPIFIVIIIIITVNVKIVIPKITNN